MCLFYFSQLNPHSCVRSPSCYVVSVKLRLCLSLSIPPAVCVSRRLCQSGPRLLRRAAPLLSHRDFDPCSVYFFLLNFLFMCYFVILLPQAGYACECSVLLISFFKSAIKFHFASLDSCMCVPFSQYHDTCLRFIFTARKNIFQQNPTQDISFLVLHF